MLKKCIPKKSYHEGKGREEREQIELSLTGAKREEDKYYGKPDGWKEAVFFFSFLSAKEVDKGTGKKEEPGKEQRGESQDIIVEWSLVAPGIVNPAQDLIEKNFIDITLSPLHEGRDQPGEDCY